jgi:hypothetical protein
VRRGLSYVTSPFAQSQHPVLTPERCMLCCGTSFFLASTVQVLPPLLPSLFPPTNCLGTHTHTHPCPCWHDQPQHVIIILTIAPFVGDSTALVRAPAAPVQNPAPLARWRKLLSRRLAADASVAGSEWEESQPLRVGGSLHTTPAATCALALPENPEPAAAACVIVIEQGGKDPHAAAGVEGCAASTAVQSADSRQRASERLKERRLALQISSCIFQLILRTSCLMRWPWDVGCGVIVK